MFKPSKLADKVAAEDASESMLDSADMPETAETSPVQEYWDNLSDDEKEELCGIVEAYEVEKPVDKTKGELDVEGMVPEEEEEEKY